jgi:hypothetical protein
MTLLVKDANTTVQSLATVTDGSGNLVPAHAPAATNAQGVAAPVGPQNPLPVVNTAGNAASDGSGTLAAGGSAQTLFGGAVPANGFLVQNNSSAALWICDTGAASNGGASIQLTPNGGVFMTPSGYKPAAPSACSAPRPARPSPPAAGDAHAAATTSVLRLLAAFPLRACPGAGRG